MNNLWKGIAIFGIWISVGIVGFSTPAATVVLGVCACIATIAVATN